MNKGIFGMMSKFAIPIRVLLISRHSVVLIGLEKLIDSQRPRMETIRKFSDCAEAFSQVEKLFPDVILLDLDFDIEEGIDAIPKLTANSNAKILILTGLRDLEMHDRVMLSGARGIIGKEEAVETVLRAVERVHADQLWLDRAGTSRLVLELSCQKPPAGHRPGQVKAETLTVREREIVEMMTTAHTGATSKAIASKLHISESTLRNHLSAIYEKLGVTTRLELWDYVNKQRLKKTKP